MAIIDTSVLVAYYYPEALSTKARSVMAGLKLRIVTSAVELEMTSALAIKVRTGDCDAQGAQLILQTYRSHLAAGVFQFREVTGEDYTLARDWIAGFTTALRAMDALHLAVAVRHALPLVTADKALAAAGKQLGAAVRMIGT